MAWARPLGFAVALGGCADAASTSRPPTIQPFANDAVATADTFGGSLIASGGGGDGGLPLLDRPVFDVPVDPPRDAVADVPSDTAPDVPADVFVDAGPVEICGNGIDDDHNGLVDEDCPSTQCPVPAAARTHVWFVGQTPPDGLAAVLAARGVTVESGAVDATALPSASVLVMVIRGSIPADWTDALRTWVEGGGALLTLIVGSGQVAPEECSYPNSLIARFGLTYLCTAPVPRGPLTALLPHPITTGLTLDATPFDNGRAVAARPGVVNTPLATVDAQIVARATSPGCGRVIVWGDEHVAYTWHWPQTRPFWEHAVGWLTAAR